MVDVSAKEETHRVARASGVIRMQPATFALIAGMLPVAIGLGEGGDFYRPLAIAIIGGTITSTLLTLLMVPTFYDSIEISKDRAVAKFERRAERWTALPAFAMTLLEAVLTLLFVTVHVALRALSALFELPHQARRWRLQQKERAMHAALLDALTQWMTGRYLRAVKSAQQVLQLEALLADTRTRDRKSVV